MWGRLLVALLLVLTGVTPAFGSTKYVGAPNSPIFTTIEKDPAFYSPKGETRYTFHWDAPQSNGATITGYDLYVRIIDQEPDSFERVEWEFDFTTSPWKKAGSFSATAKRGTLLLPVDYEYQKLEFTLVARNRFGSSPQPNIPWVDIAIGDNAACALNKSGQLYCWGNSAGKGELFTDDTGFTLPRLARLPGPAQSVAAGLNHFCAVVSGDVYCWGNNEYAQVRAGGESVYSPTKVSLPAKAKSITLGSSHSCALLVNGAGYCWGSNLDGQIGSDSLGTPVKLAFEDIQKLDAGSNSTCALSGSGAIRCTGFIPEQFVTIDQNLGFLPASDFAAGDHVVCAITDPGVQCMGFGKNGEAGLSFGTFATPHLVPDTKDLFETIETKRYGVCGLSEDSAVHCFGFSWAYLQYWDAQPSPTNPYTARYYSGFLKPVELANRSMATFYAPEYAPEPSNYLDLYGAMYIDGYLNQQPVMRDPVKIGMGVGANCGIDSFGQLWCSRTQGNDDEEYSWINASVVPKFDEQIMGYHYSLDLSGDESDLVALNSLLIPAAAFTFLFESNERRYTGRLSISGKNEVGETLRAVLPHRVPTGSHIEYLWYQGIGDFEPGNLQNFWLIGESNTPTYKVREKDAAYSIGVRVRIASPAGRYGYDPSPSLSPGEGQAVQQPIGWAKRLSQTQAKLYAKDVVGAGKVSFRLNGREIAWVNAQSLSDPKLRIVGSNNYLVRTVNLRAGKNVLEIFIDGVSVRRTIYSR